MPSSATPTRSPWSAAAGSARTSSAPTASRARATRARGFCATVAAEGRTVWAAPLAVRPLRPEDAPACDAIIAGLPDWFGLEEGVAACAHAVRTQPGVVAGEAGSVAGFLTYARPFPASAEITWMAVAAGRRGGGLGRRLVEALAAALAGAGVRLLAVKTLSASADSAAYAATRAFYAAAGFVPLLELPDLWGPENPCLVLARPLPGVL